MSRFDYVDDYDGEGMPYALWERAVSNALGGKKGQQVLAEMEQALLAMPSKRLIEGELRSADNQVCAVGAYVAHKRAQQHDIPIEEAIGMLPADGDADPLETADAGAAAGMQFTVAWHFEYLNDETFRSATPEERYQKILAWVRRAQGKETVAA